MPAARYTKDPAAVLDYVVNWSTWLDGDTISSATVTASTGLTLDSSSNTTTTVTGWLSGGTAGTSYTVTFQIITAAGRTDERSIAIFVTDR